MLCRLTVWQWNEGEKTSQFELTKIANAKNSQPITHLNCWNQITARNMRLRSTTKKNGQYPVLIMTIVMHDMWYVCVFVFYCCIWRSFTVRNQRNELHKIEAKKYENLARYRTHTHNSREFENTESPAF